MQQVAPQVQTQQAAPQKFEFAPFEFPKTINVEGEDYEPDPATAKLFEEQYTKLTSQVQPVIANLQAQLQREQQRNQMIEMERRRASEEEYSRRLDQEIANLGNEWAEVFGTGSGQELMEQSRTDAAAMTALNQRVMLDNTIAAIRAENGRLGNPPMSLDQEILWALQRNHHDRFQQMIRQQDTKKSNGRKGVQAARPTARTKPVTNEEEAFAQRFNREMRKQGKDAIDFSRQPGEFATWSRNACRCRGS